MTQSIQACDVVLLSTADWDNPFWTNKQHVAAELARRGFRILYIESLGLRRPTVSSHDLRRILRRLWRAVRPPRRVRDNLWVWSPLVLPAHERPWVRGLNRAMLLVGLKFWMKRLRIHPEMLWTYSPLTAEVVPLSRFRTVVYHCVDEIKAAPGMPEGILARAEQELVARADVIFATSHRLAESRRRTNRNTFYLSNVADYEHFAKARDPETRIPDDLIGIPEPRLGFVGAISGYKVDFRLLKSLAQAHPEWSVVLIGEVGEGDPWTDVTELNGVPNVHFMGPRPYSLLPAYLRGIQVGILPNCLNEYTASMFPMKFFEYLAAGLPIVSVALPALREHADVVYLAENAETFMENVKHALGESASSLDRRLERARRNTYVSRTEAMLDILNKVATN